MAADVLTPRVRVVREHHLVKELALSGPLTVGRLPDNDIVIEDDLVSGHHGRIEKSGPHWRYVDLGSTNGSVVAAGPTLRGGESFDIVEGLPGAAGRDGARHPAGGRQHLHPQARRAGGRALLVARRPAARAAADAPAAARRADGALQDRRHHRAARDHRALEPQRGAHRGPLGLVASRRAALGRQPLAAARSGQQQRHASAAPQGDVGPPHRERRAHHPRARSTCCSSRTESRSPRPTRVLAALEADGRLQRGQARQAKQEWAAGQGRLGEILVRNGWLSPGQWREAASDSTVVSRPRRLRWVLLTVLLLLLAALLGWLAARGQR
jgi:hypothetical protein